MLKEKSWVGINEELPELEGDYLCKIVNGERKYEATRRLIKGRWWGGCRPFADNEVVVAWLRPSAQRKPGTSV